MKRLICRIFGHRWMVGEWIKSPYTVASHTRGHFCARCHESRIENGYFDARLWFPQDSACVKVD